MRGLRGSTASVMACALGALAVGCTAGPATIEDTASTTSNILNPQRSAAAYTEAVQVSVHNNANDFCTGVVIAPRVVLTASHCVSFNPDDDGAVRTEHGPSPHLLQQVARRRARPHQRSRTILRSTRSALPTTTPPTRHYTTSVSSTSTPRSAASRFPRGTRRSTRSARRTQRSLRSVVRPFHPAQASC